MTEIQIVTAVPLLVLLAVATLIDWRTHSIPNALSFGGALFGLVLQSSTSGVMGLVLGLSGWAICLVCFLPFYMSRGMAAGDVKLMAAVGAFLGPIGGLAACMCTLVVGALIGLVSLGYVNYLRPAGNESGHSEPTLRQSLQERIPYAGAIAAGSAIAIVQPAVLTDMLADITPILQNGVFV